MTKSFCEEIGSLIGNYWWNQQDKDHTAHWVSWQKLTMSKAQGGLGFRDMHIFNQALLAKQAWRLVQRPDCLYARVLKAKYFPKGNLLDTVFTSDESPVWQGIEYGPEVLIK